MASSESVVSCAVPEIFKAYQVLVDGSGPLPLDQDTFKPPAERDEGPSARKLAQCGCNEPVGNVVESVAILWHAVVSSSSPSLLDPVPGGEDAIKLLAEGRSRPALTSREDARAAEHPGSGKTESGVRPPR